MTLEDLVLKRFTVKKFGGVVGAVPNRLGRYQASSAKQIENWLNNCGSPRGIYVLRGKTWVEALKP